MLRCLCVFKQNEQQAGVMKGKVRDDGDGGLTLNFEKNDTRPRKVCKVFLHTRGRAKDGGKETDVFSALFDARIADAKK